MLIFMYSLALASPCPSGMLTVGTDATFPPFSSKVGEQYSGYEIELGGQVAQRLGCGITWVNSSFDGIFPALLSGKFDAVIASVTITEERRQSMLFSVPYMEAGQAIVQRDGDATILDIAGLKGKRVGVGLNTTGQYLLEPHPEVGLVKYPSVDLTLADLRAGRLDVVVGDRPVFAYMLQQSFPDLKLGSTTLNSESWGIVFAPERRDLKEAVDVALSGMAADGSLRALEEKYLGTAAPSTGAATGHFRLDRLLQSLPMLALGARWTLLLSMSSFLCALPMALLLALARGSRLALLRFPAAAWVELLRGTPLLVQVFFLYFVLPSFGISLADTTTAVLALSINASAYISEILRAALGSIEAGQSEAAAALGLSRVQVLRYVLVPQAFRRALPPLTNEAIALIKESSLVSVMGMTELTRTGQELSSRYADPLSIWPGVALTYFLMPLPLARLSAWLERRLSVGIRRAGV
ncbi:MAG TPA: ABC transporter substrate-binding protein/permease [Myxococcota bacterium]|nr:ABC transporter substrate-binding protein/permease [Myxococcota bacterium]